MGSTKGRRSPPVCDGLPDRGISLHASCSRVVRGNFPRTEFWGELLPRDHRYRAIVQVCHVNPIRQGGHRHVHRPTPEGEGEHRRNRVRLAIDDRQRTVVKDDPGILGEFAGGGEIYG